MYALSSDFRFQYADRNNVLKGEEFFHSNSFAYRQALIFF